MIFTFCFILKNNRVRRQRCCHDLFIEHIQDYYIQDKLFIKTCIAFCIKTSIALCRKTCIAFVICFKCTQLQILSEVKQNRLIKSEQASIHSPTQLNIIDMILKHLNFNLYHNLMHIQNFIHLQ